MKAVLYELGIHIESQSTKSLLSSLDEKIQNLKEKEQKESAECLELLRNFGQTIIETMSQNTQAISHHITELADNIDICHRLMTIPYIGSICSMALAFVMDDPGNFKNGRQFADYCGMAPYHTGTGGKVKVMGIARKGSRVLFQTSPGLYTRIKKDMNKPKSRQYCSQWIVRLIHEKTTKQAVCAIANKICRTAWAIANEPGGCYEYHKTTQVRIVTGLSDESVTEAL